MGRVLIIKNNNSDDRIHKYAEQSYKRSEKGYYNSLNGTLNQNALIEQKSKFEGNGIVLLITYKNSELKEIQDVYIGDKVNINYKNSIEYVMKVHLTCESHKRTIDSIIDKIDLDIKTDFEYGQYVIMIEMESLYEELRERIIAQQKVENSHAEVSGKQCEESYVMSPLSQKNEQSIRINKSDDVGDYRTEFQRDRERIVNCKAFRRLVDKAQIFGSEKGDYFRTRMTHSLEVNQISKAIAYALRLNLDLTEAIALGHDLGHTPFGHQGERTLDQILAGEIEVGISATEQMFKKRCFGGFKHNYQSARILTVLEEKYKGFPGLNVSVQVIEGVLKHTKLKPDKIDIQDFLSKEYLEKINIDYEKKLQICSSLEGQVVAIADEIAQRGHDVDDALTSGVMTIEELQDRLTINKCDTLHEKIEKEIADIESAERLIIDKKELKTARIVSVIINYFIQSAIDFSLQQIEKYGSLDCVELDNKIKMIQLEPEAEKVSEYLEKVVQKKVICNFEVARADYNASMIVQTLFEKYYKNPRLLHSGTIHKIFLETLRHENIEVSNSAISLNDVSIEIANKEIADITTAKLDGDIIIPYLDNKDNSSSDKNIILFEKRRILIRAIVDYIAGMTDGYAVEEYEKLK